MGATGTNSPQQQPSRLRIFLCHSSEDKPFVRELYRRLRTDGFAPWLDEEELLPGQDWQEEIPAAIDSCHVVVVCLSRNSVSKEGYLQREIRDALYVAEEKPEGSIFIIPVRIEKEVNVPKRLSRWQWANLFDEGGYERLRRALTVRLGQIVLPAMVSVPEQPDKPEETRLVEKADAHSTDSGSPANGQNADEVDQHRLPAVSATSSMIAAPAKAPSPAAGPGPSVSAPVLHDQTRRTAQQKWRWGLAAFAALVIVTVSGATYLVHKARSSVSVKLHANVDGAKFTLDGRPIDPGNLSLVPGKEYTIEASREGYQADAKKITPTTTPGGPIEFVLAPLAPKLLPSSDLMEGPISLWEHQPGAGEVGFLQVQANVPGAELRIDKTSKWPMPNGSQKIFLKAGKHQVQVVAPGYPDSEMREVEIQKGQTVKQAFTLSARQAQLMLTGVEPGAKLYVDGEQQGTTLTDGSFKLAVSPGEHKVVLKKDDYEDSPTVTKTFKANQPETITGRQLPLQKYGSIKFIGTPPTATITIRSAKGQSRTVQPNESVPLPKGVYVWTLEAEHFQKSGTATIEPGGAISISPGLQLVGPQELKAADLFENPSLWSAQGAWSVFNHSGYGWLKIRNGSFNVIIEKKRSGTFLGNSKAEWTLDYRGEKDRIIYSVGGNTLSRRVINSGNESEPVKTQFKERSNAIYQFIFDITATQIIVRDNGNNVIDQFDRPDPSIDLGKIGFRGDIFISVQRLQ